MATTVFWYFRDLPGEIQEKVFNFYCWQKWSICVWHDNISNKTRVSGPSPPAILFVNHDTYPVACRAWLKSYSGTLVLGDNIKQHNLDSEHSLFQWILQNTTHLQTFPQTHYVNWDAIWPQLPRMRQLDAIKTLDTNYVRQNLVAATEKELRSLRERTEDKWGLAVVVLQDHEVLEDAKWSRMTFAMQTERPVEESIRTAFWKGAYLGKFEFDLLKSTELTFWQAYADC